QALRRAVERPAVLAVPEVVGERGEIAQHERDPDPVELVRGQTEGLDARRHDRQRRRQRELAQPRWLHRPVKMESVPQRGRDERLELGPERRMAPRRERLLAHQVEREWLRTTAAELHGRADEEIGALETLELPVEEDADGSTGAIQATRMGAPRPDPLEVR